MSRYDWPQTARHAEEGDDPNGRALHNARRRAGLPRSEAVAALRTPAPRPQGPRLRAPASSENELWQPLGPATLLNGQAEGSPRVCGRVNALAVHPDGQRAYAAAANGGIWATTDGGASWVSIGGLASTNVAGIKRPAHRNSCGALHVVWRDPPFDSELVFLGTGEPHAAASGRVSDGEHGLGIFVLDRSQPAAADDPWQREAPQLVNDAIYGFASNADGTEVYAATRTGLYQRPAGPVAAEAAWTRIVAEPFDVGDVQCTAVLYTPEETDDPAHPTPEAQRRPGRLWVWLESGAKFGLWVRTDGSAAFAKVAMDAANPAAIVFKARRGTLAAAPKPTQVWLLVDLARNTPAGLFRIANTVRADGAPTALAVNGTLDILRDQGWYNIALAVDPSNESRLAMAGSFLGDPGDPADAALLTTLDNATRSYDASIVLDTVVPDAVAGQLKFGATPGVGQFIGMGVHPDVHALAFSNGGSTLWTGCDGGVYRSDRLSSSAGFYPRNHGLSISESTFVACSAVFEGDMIAGLQDNGITERLSTGVWRINIKGDGGGLLLDPLRPGRWLAQSTRGTWYTEASPWLAGPLRRGHQWAGVEKDGAAFYSLPAVVEHERGSAPASLVPMSQVLIGTHRLWYSDTNGASWVTLPSAEDPLPAVIAAPAPPPGSPVGTPAVPAVVDTAKDDLHETVRACRWQDPDTAWVLTDTSVHRFDRVPGSHNNAKATWAVARIASQGAPPTPPAPTTPPAPSGKAKKADPPPPPVPPPPDPAAPMFQATTWTEIEPNLIKPPSPAVPVKALYLGTTGNPDVAAADTLWWYDGAAADPRWWPTGLRTKGNNGQPLPAAVSALAIDPDLPDEVWVGTNVGVFKGVRSAVANPPAGQPPWDWAWSAALNGLPEAGVEDLSLYRDTYNDGDGNPHTLRLLRAAIGARGLWELRLDQSAVAPLTYLRVHGGDLRHRLVARLLQRDASTERPWHASPDVRPRLRPTADALPKPPAAGWWRAAFQGQTERLRRFQAALRKRTSDPRVIGNGLWDGYFSELLREHGAPKSAQPSPGPGLPAHERVYIDPTFWDTVFTGANRSAEPWGPGRATEADLLELTAALPEGDALKAACELPRKPWRVEIVVHHRGRLARDGSEVRVTLLYWVDPAAKDRAKFDQPAKWAPGDIGWAQAVSDMLNSADGASAALPAGWRYAGTTDATRRVDLSGQTLDPFTAGVASFDLAIPPAVKIPKDGVVLLVAVIRGGAGPIALPTLPLRDLVLTHPGVAVRAVHIA